jgi:hypothetical protein
MNENPFSGFEPPEPPPGLREAALRAGRRELASVPAPDLWTRLYRNRAARLAWAASVVLLAALHLALPRRPVTSPATASAPRLDPEVGAIAKLPRINEQAASAYSGERS